VVPLPARVSLLSGIYVTTEIPDLQAIAVQRCLYHSLARILEAPLELIFMLRGAPKAHEVCFAKIKLRVVQFRGFSKMTLSSLQAQAPPCQTCQLRASWK